MADLSYTVSLTLPIARDAGEPLTPVEAVRVFQDEAETREWVYAVTDDQTGETVRVDMPAGTILSGGEA